jgi:hypothetical protein
VTFNLLPKAGTPSRQVATAVDWRPDTPIPEEAGISALATRAKAQTPAWAL